MAKKKEGTVFSSRTDRLGARLVAAINAIRVSRQINYDVKIGWKFHPYGISNDGFSEIFTEEFCNEHIISHEEVPEKLFSIEDWQKNSFVGDIMVQNCFGRVRVEGDFSEPESFAEIISSGVIRNDLISSAEEIFSRIENDFNKCVAFHIRRGDLLSIDLSPQVVSFIDRFNPYEIFHELYNQIIEDGEFSIIIFSDDSEAISNFPESKEIASINDYLPEGKFSVTQIAMIEILLLSKMERIYGSWSAFTELAHLIGENQLLLAREEILPSTTLSIFYQKAIDKSLNPNERALCLASYVDLIVQKQELPDWDDLGILVSEIPNSFSLIKQALLRGSNNSNGSRQNNDDTNVLYHLSVLAREQGNIEEAIDFSRRSVTIEPDNHGLRHHLGNLYHWAGEHKSAIEEQTIASYSETGIRKSALIQLSRLYRKEKNWDALTKIGNEIYQLSPDSNEAFESLFYSFMGKSEEHHAKLVKSVMITNHWFRGNNLPLCEGEASLTNTFNKKNERKPLKFLCSIGKFAEEDDFWLKKQFKNSSTALEKGGVDYVLNLSFSDIPADFISKNERIFSEKRGAGLWLWKPYIILKSLEKISEGDYLFYSDSGCYFNSSLDGLIDNWPENDTTGVMTFGWGGIEKEWTKRDTFVIMDSDTDEIKNSSPQVWAGFILFRKCDSSVEFVKKWLEYCQIIENLDDSPSKIKAESSQFQEHRHDQSILSVLSKKNGILPRPLERILWKDVVAGKLNANHKIVSTRRNNDVESLDLHNFSFFSSELE